MAAIRERWTADDWEFTEGDIRDVEYRTGQLGTPPVRGANAEVANRTGTVWRPKLHGAGTFTLEVWLGTYQRQAQALWDELLRAVVQPHRLVSWRRITADGETRSCLGEVTGALQPTAVGQNGYRASIEVTVPGGYWRGDQLFTVSTAHPTKAGAFTTDLDLTPFAPSTAPLEQLTITLAGYLSAATVTDITDRGRGDVLSYAGLIPDFQSLTLNCATWTATPSAGWPFASQSVNYTGDRFLTIAATPPGVTPRLRLAADNAGLVSQLTVSGYRSYLC